jgi:uncharacterized membrane protein
MAAFSDGVIAILITVMVLELHVPLGTSWSSLREIIPVLLNYLLSFVFLGIYWNNHHHLLHVTKSVNGLSLWANLHLLFWLSLIPVTTAWMGRTDFAHIPVAVYGIVLLAAGLAYVVLQTVLIRHQRPQSLLADAVGLDVKGKISLVLYLLGIGLAFVDRWVAIAAYAMVALMWLIPDRRFERAVTASAGK